VVADLLSRVAGIAAEGALARPAERELRLVHIRLGLKIRLVVGREVVDKVGPRGLVLLSTKYRNC